MKKTLLIAFAAFLPFATARGQEAPTIEEEIFTAEKTRSGWSIVGLPNISYTSDNGLKLGAFADLYYYGPDRCDFPTYHHKFSLDIGYSFKGNRYGYFFFDSFKLIPGVRFTASVEYQSHKSFPFMGFNGMASPFVESLYYTSVDGKETVSGYYQMRKDMLRIFVDFKGDILPGLQWAAGLNIWNQVIKDTDWMLRTSEHTNLLSKYIDSGIISPEEARGGFHVELKGGINYDTRDNEASPRKGIWAELFLYGSPDIVRWRNSYLNLSAHFRHYVPLVRDRLTFAYHLAYQGTLLGEMPFYMLSNIAVLNLRQVDSDGLGSYTSLRGLRYNRLLGKGYAWTNIELRWFIFDFDWLGINWGIAANPLFDAGMVVQPYRLDKMIASGNADIYSGISGDKLHCSAGMGLKLSVDYNFILSVEYAYPFLRRAQDGPGSFAATLNYIF